MLQISTDNNCLCSRWTPGVATVNTNRFIRWDGHFCNYLDNSQVNDDKYPFYRNINTINLLKYFRYAHRQQFPIGLSELFRSSFSNHLPRFIQTRPISEEFYSTIYTIFTFRYLLYIGIRIWHWMGFDWNWMGFWGTIVHCNSVPKAFILYFSDHLANPFSPFNPPFKTRNWRFQVKCEPVNKLYSFNLWDRTTLKWLLSDTDEFLSKRCLCLAKQSMRLSLPRSVRCGWGGTAEYISLHCVMCRCLKEQV